MYRPFLFNEPSQRSHSNSPREKVAEKSLSHHALKHDVNIKIVVVGAQGVGKTTIVRQYLGKQLSAKYVPTIGPEVISKYVPLNSLQCHVESKGKLPEGLSYDRVRVDFWEVPHQELYGPNIARIIGKTNGFVFVFDSSSYTSFGAVNEWFSAIKAFKKGEGAHERSESPSVVPSPPIMPVKSENGISSTIEYGKANPFSVPSILLAHKSDVKSSSAEGASLISGLNAYCSEYGALFWSKTSSVDGTTLRHSLDTFVNSVFDNYLRREELRIVMEAERLRMRRPKIRPIKQVQIVHDDSESGQDEAQKVERLEKQKQMMMEKQNEARKATLAKAEKLQKDVKEYHDNGRIRIRDSSLLEDKKKVLLDKFNDEFTKMEAAVSTLVSSAGGGVGGAGGTPTQKSGDEDLSKVIDRVQTVFDKKKAKWNDILSKEIK